jgi:hypothetical protein
MDFWNWLQGLFARPGTKGNPIPLAPIQVVASRTRGPNGEIQYPMNEALNSSFVQDTLYSLIGGSPERVEYRQRPGWPYSPRTLGAVEGSPSDLNLVLYSQLLDPRNEYSTDALLSHEGGHIFSARDIDPSIIQAVKSQWTPQVASSWGERSRNPEEMFAEAFQRAIYFLRDTQQLPSYINPEYEYNNKRDIAKSYSPPGTELLIQYMLGTPVYQSHPINTMRLYR